MVAVELSQLHQLPLRKVMREAARIAATKAAQFGLSLRPSLTVFNPVEPVVHFIPELLFHVLLVQS